MKYISVGVLWPLALWGVQAAPPAPETCDPSAIQSCLDRFEMRFAECGEGDTHCQCLTVLEKGASCYAACPQEAMTTFIKTYSDGMCATFDPHMHARRADESDSRFDIEAARIKSWLGIDVLEDHDVEQHKIRAPKARAENSSINSGDAEVDEENSTNERPKRKKDRKINQDRENNQRNLSTGPVRGTDSTAIALATKTTQSSYSSITDVGKHVDEPQMKAVTVTAADPTTTASLSPQEYQSRLEKERYKANLRSIRSNQRRISSEQEAERALARSRIAEATASADEKYIEKSVAATATTSASKTHDKGAKKEHTSTAKSDASTVVPAAFTLITLIAAIALTV